jgi:hypothetical protein
MFQFNRLNVEGDRRIGNRLRIDRNELSAAAAAGRK